MEKWPQSDPNRPPKTHRKSMKINVGAFKDPPERTLAPNDHQSGAPRPHNASKIVPRPIKINKCECKYVWIQFSILLVCECKFAWKNNPFLKLCNDSNPADLSNPTSPVRLQITNLLVARGAGGKGEALRVTPTPRGSRTCQSVAQRSFIFFYSSGS